MVVENGQLLHTLIFPNKMYSVQFLIWRGGIYHCEMLKMQAVTKLKRT